jgi:uncharacterized LabA/DUF88 family protein
MYAHSPLDRVAIFIDGENIHYSAKHLNMRLDYLKLCKLLAGERRLVRAYFYTAVSQQSEGKIDFINFLKLNGFTVVTREVKSFNDTDGSNRSIRGSLDMEMAMDVIGLSETLDAVVICTGDGDFRPLVDAVARKGKHVEVCALREMTSTDLIASADSYIDLASLKDRIALDAPPPQQSSRDIRNDIDTSADGFDDFKVQDTTFDF